MKLCTKTSWCSFSPQNKAILRICGVIGIAISVIGFMTEHSDIFSYVTNAVPGLFGIILLSISFTTGNKNKKKKKEETKTEPKPPIQSLQSPVEPTTLSSNPENDPLTSFPSGLAPIIFAYLKPSELYILSKHPPYVGLMPFPIVFQPTDLTSNVTVFTFADWEQLGYRFSAVQRSIQASVTINHLTTLTSIGQFIEGTSGTYDSGTYSFLRIPSFVDLETYCKRSPIPIKLCFWKASLIEAVPVADQPYHILVSDFSSGKAMGQLLGTKSSWTRQATLLEVLSWLNFRHRTVTASCIMTSEGHLIQVVAPENGPKTIHIFHQTQVSSLYIDPYMLQPIHCWQVP